MSGVRPDTGNVVVRDQGYYLPQHVYACRTDEAVVFLDAKKDRYFGLGGAGVAALPEFIKNWAGAAPDPGGASETSSHHLDVQRVATHLIERGLLRPYADGATPLHRPRAPPLAIDLPQSATEARRRLRAIDLFHFAIACLQAFWLLKRLPLAVIASRVTAARATRAPRDIGEVFKHVQAFRKLRRLFFSEKDRCLLNALALVLFLRHYGQFPLFVIGVKTRPFAAHSWVQQEDILLEGDAASVCHFVPILVA